MGVEWKARVKKKREKGGSWRESEGDRGDGEGGERNT